jgi:two-component system, OmpR family, phosphate regulon response regulator PhoB
VRPSAFQPIKKEIGVRINDLLRRVNSLHSAFESARVHSVDIDDRVVDVYVQRLRKALSTGSERDPILTVRGTGYAFDEAFGKP